jgi:hypothetical protein
MAKILAHDARGAVGFGQPFGKVAHLGGQHELPVGCAALHIAEIGQRVQQAIGGGAVYPGGAGKGCRIGPARALSATSSASPRSSARTWG